MISVTLFLFFCPHPIKLIDRKMWLITPTKSRGPQLLMQLYMSGETPKKVSSAKGDWLFFFLLKGEISSLKKKVKIFSESEFEIRALIYRSVGVDLSLHVGCNRLRTAGVSPCSSPLRNDFYQNAKMLLVLIRFFPLTGRLCWRGSTFRLSKCDFSRLFHPERSWHAHWFSAVFVYSREVDLSFDARSFSVTVFER